MSPEVAMDPNSKDKPAPTCRVVVSKDEAAKMKVGSDISLSMSGQVKSLHPDYDNKEMYEVEIENPEVEVESAEEDANEGDEDNMAKMPLGKLKKKIMPKDGE